MGDSMAVIEGDINRTASLRIDLKNLDRVEIDIPLAVPMCQQQSLNFRCSDQYHMLACAQLHRLYFRHCDVRRCEAKKVRLRHYCPIESCDHVLWPGPGRRRI